MDFRLLHLIAMVIDACDRPPDRGPSHPPTETIRVVATLRRFLREGTPWRSLTATEDQASGSTLRRCLAHWAGTGLLAKVHALLVGMLRGHPDLTLAPPRPAPGAARTRREVRGEAAALSGPLALGPACGLP
ncbi:hypothetical protein [Siccirubricoccus sp. G192]|uniref:hypothetical protein n=1 Tax=Siccirubricoccus sp. G192 TaxID=2849651 RepID=UPI001C2BC428|nr:hypothetical protein [Siccirubricoccus sp. G192]MBV1800421.1 hypothetical protein [Siccirubricoccus sp. G192]